MKVTRIAIILALSLAHAFRQRPVSFTLPDHTTQIQADLYGYGHHAVILAHGGRFDKSSWSKQAKTLANAGFMVLAVQYRGDSVFKDGTPNAAGSNKNNAADVLAAAAYCHKGAKSISGNRR
jgi:dipeptidyl aminopeptidase/acylaminoacyl peptidase